jgi:hypothetical protein
MTFHKAAARVAAITLFAMTCAVAFCQPALGQVDDFEDGSTAFWSGGSNPTNIADGGPMGSGDNYLQITPNVGNQHLATFNALQWAGNFSAAGVKVIRMQVRNFGPSDVRLRLVLFDSTLTTRWVTKDASAPWIAANSGWRTLQFVLQESQFTRALGTESFSNTISNVGQFMIRHNSTASAQGHAVTATVGIDNITATNVVEVFPTSATIATGTAVNSTLSNLFASDNQSISIASTRFSQFAQLDLATSVPPATYSSLTMTHEISVSRPLHVTTIRLKPTASANYTIVNSFASDVLDTTRTTVVSSNVNSFIDANGGLLARIVWGVTGDARGFDGWLQRVDLFKFQLAVP